MQLHAAHSSNDPWLALLLTGMTVLAFVLLVELIRWRNKYNDVRRELAKLTGQDEGDIYWHLPLPERDEDRANWWQRGERPFGEPM